MRLRIAEANFTAKFDWLFRLIDDSGNNVFIMNDSFYKSRSLKSPITKKTLDYFDKGLWINAHIKEVNSIKVVIEVW